MQWSDEAIILGAYAHGESAQIVQLFTPTQGRHAGIVKGRKVRAILQPGNEVSVRWNARLSEHLGMFSLELGQPHAALVMADSERLSALSSAVALVEQGFPERDPHPMMYGVLKEFLFLLSMGAPWQQAYVALEMTLLSELGFGLDLSECAATGVRENLVYISPKSGRAVSAEAGEPYKEKLFKLPGFIADPESLIPTSDLPEAFRMAGHFLERCWEQVTHKPLPATRGRLSAVFSPVKTLEFA